MTLSGNDVAVGLEVFVGLVVPVAVWKGVLVGDISVAVGEGVLASGWVVRVGEMVGSLPQAVSVKATIRNKTKITL